MSESIEANRGDSAIRTDENLPAPAQPPGSHGWAWRVVAWLAVAAGFVLMLRLDIPLMRWRYRVFPHPPEGWTQQVLLGFRDAGQVVPIVVALIIVHRLDRRRRWAVIATVLGAQALASVSYNVGKSAVARYRPYATLAEVQADLAASGRESGVEAAFDAMDRRESWLGWKRPLRASDGRPALWGEDTKSFPSGHSAAAFAFAGTMAWFYPRLRRLFWILAVGCALSRYADAVHWPSDCWAGATLGYLSAWLALRPIVKKYG